MRTGITLKLVVGLICVLFIGFVILGILTTRSNRMDQAELLQSVLSEFAGASHHSIELLHQGLKQTGEQLAVAHRETSDLARSLYDKNARRMVESLAILILPAIQNFDYETAGKNANDLLKNNKEVKWVSFITSEKPQTSDIFTFGDKEPDNVNNFMIFSYENSKGSTYLKVDMQVSMADLDRFLENLGGIYQSVEAKNGEAENVVAVNMEQAGKIAAEKAMSIAETARQKYTVKFSLFAAAVLFIVCATLWVFIRRIVVGPLLKIIEGLSENSEQISSAAGEVSAASQTLAEGSSEQAAAIEETSSSLEEMSSMTKQNAGNAGQADSLMKQANQVVNKANTSMGRLTTSMQEISKASDETSKIIKTIDEIAFQTNLLALNAAVEAARAGQAGAGFAVVADEVRNLAKRAAEAAKNTEALIAGTMKKISEGTLLVKTTNDAFKEVASNTAKVGELVGEIAAASTEQSQGIAQVNIAVTEMDKVTQQNAATAEESASAAEELNAQAEEMKSFVADLTAMVGGNGAMSANGSRSASRPKAALHTRQVPQKALAVTNKTTKGNALSLHRSREVNPDDIISMDESDFKDF